MRPGAAGDRTRAHLLYLRSPHSIPASSETSCASAVQSAVPRPFATPDKKRLCTMPAKGIGIFTCSALSRARFKSLRPNLHLKTYWCVVLFSDYLAVVLINCTGKQSLTKHVNDLIS